MNENDTFATIKVEHNISLERVRSALCDAFEGGVGYWCTVAGYTFPDGVKYEDFQEFGPGGHKGKYCLPDDYWHPVELIPLVPGCGLVVEVDDNEGPNHGPSTHTLTVEKIKTGLQVMAEKFPKHFQEKFIDDNGDADTGDIFLQCCLFSDYVKEKGDVIFG